MLSSEYSQGETPLQFLAVCGSMTAQSALKDALSTLLHSAEQRGAQTQFLDLYELDLPLFRPETPLDWELRQAVQNADVIVLGTPDYHGSMSGAMKNFLDHHWREFAGKLFGYLCTSHEKGLTAMDGMRTAVRQCYGWSLPYGLSLEGRELESEATQNRLHMMARDLCVYGTLIRDQFQRDKVGQEAATFAAHYRQVKP